MSTDRRTTLELELGDDPDALMRVLTVLRRRRCRVTSVDFSGPDRHRAGQLVVGLEPPPTHAHCVDSWLANVVGVLGVERVA
jgi:hypothetical protein